MTIESEQVFTRDRFEELVLGEFFRDAPPETARVGRAFARFCFSLDGRCHSQHWEGVPHRVAVFSLPPHLRRNPISKNYAALYRPTPPAYELWLEIILPATPERREAVLAGHDFSRAQFHALGQPRFLLGPSDAPDAFAHLILGARNAKIRRLKDLLNDRGAELAADGEAPAE